LIVALQPGFVRWDVPELHKIIRREAAAQGMDW